MNQTSSVWVPLRSRSFPFQSFAIACSQRATTLSVISLFAFALSSESRIRTITRRYFDVRTSS